MTHTQQYSTWATACHRPAKKLFVLIHLYLVTLPVTFFFVVDKAHISLAAALIRSLYRTNLGKWRSILMLKFVFAATCLIKKSKQTKKSPCVSVLGLAKHMLHDPTCSRRHPLVYLLWKTEIWKTVCSDMLLFWAINTISPWKLRYWRDAIKHKTNFITMLYMYSICQVTDWAALNGWQ